jgi:DNA-binding transcriptional regulator YdaS (Cro superfamily)
MELREYLFRERKSVTGFAKELFVSRNHMSQVTLGKLKPSIRLARDIERITEGKVTIADLLPVEE